jgi:hypothetical protein
MADSGRSSHSVNRHDQQYSTRRQLVSAVRSWSAAFEDGADEGWVSSRWVKARWRCSRATGQLLERGRMFRAIYVGLCARSESPVTGLDRRVPVRACNFAPTDIEWSIDSSGSIASRCREFLHMIGIPRATPR